MLFLFNSFLQRLYTYEYNYICTYVCIEYCDHSDMLARVVALHVQVTLRNSGCNGQVMALMSVYLKITDGVLEKILILLNSNYPKQIIDACDV